MGYKARIECDSITPYGARLTTFVVSLPRIVLAEFNTHRLFSRNSASSRAIPVWRMIDRIETDPFVPEEFGKNKRGMQSTENLDDYVGRRAREVWEDARQFAVARARELAELGVHKQFANRLLEPFAWHTIVVTATEWDNFFHLRCHRDAHPAIRRPAEMMRELYAASKPDEVGAGWHLPFVRPEDDGMDETDLRRVSVARCARVSYLTHDGRRDPAADLALHDRLLESGHMSPFEHVARPLVGIELEDWRLGRSRLGGNFEGWCQYRKLIHGEADMLGGRS